MEIKEFKKTISKLLTDYGFKRINKYYYFENNEISLITFLNLRYGSYVLSYNFSLHAIHDNSERKIGNPFTGYDSLLIDTTNSQGKKFLNPKDITLKSLIEDIEERTHRYFDPFKKDIEDYILYEVENRNRRNTGDNIVLLKDIKEFLRIIK